MTSDYFDGTMVNRQRLVWTVATRRQLERWEPLVAAAVLASFEDRKLAGADVWSAEIEHHFALVAAGHLLWALELDPPSKVAIPPTVRDELREGRDLHEHWPDNLSVFNVRPRVEQPPRRTGRAFAARNPDRSPYAPREWNNKTGARLLPNVSASTLRRVLDDVEAEVLADDATLAVYVPPRAPSPWLYKDGEWWPKAAA
jgi:hypothetical protein